MNKEQLDAIKTRLEKYSDTCSSRESEMLAMYMGEEDVPVLVAEVERLQRFKNYFDELHGEGLKMANWHQNGDLELFDNFYKEAVNFMEKESCD